MLHLVTIRASALVAQYKSGRALLAANNILSTMCADACESSPFAVNSVSVKVESSILGVGTSFKSDLLMFA